MSVCRCLVACVRAHACVFVWEKGCCVFIASHALGCLKIFSSMYADFFFFAVSRFIYLARHSEEGAEL